MLWIVVFFYFNKVFLCLRFRHVTALFFFFLFFHQSFPHFVCCFSRLAAFLFFFSEKSAVYLEDPMFIMSTNTMSIVIKTLFSHQEMFIPKPVTRLHQNSSSSSSTSTSSTSFSSNIQTRRAKIALEVLMSALVPFDVWRPLLQMLSCASGILSRRANKMSEDVLEKATMAVRSISCLLTQSLVAIPAWRFQLCEQVVRMEIVESWPIPKSIMQHVLSDVPKQAEIHQSVRELRDMDLLLADERVIDVSWSFLGAIVRKREIEIQHSFPSPEIAKTTTLFVVTSHRVVLFERSRAFTHEELHSDHGTDKVSHPFTWSLLDAVSVNHVCFCFFFPCFFACSLFFFFSLLI